jgi:hypothetical protein
MPNLTFERLAIVLALTGCSKATPAADAVRSDPGATSQAVTQGAPPPRPITEPLIATVTASASPSPGPGGAASATDLKKKLGHSPTGQASCGAGSCTSDMKKK